MAETASYYREILSRVAVTLAMLAVIRAGHFIPVPGVELAHLPVHGLGTEGERPPARGSWARAGGGGGGMLCPCRRQASMPHARLYPLHDIQHHTGSAPFRGVGSQC